MALLFVLSSSMWLLSLAICGCSLLLRRLLVLVFWLHSASVTSAELRPRVVAALLTLPSQALLLLRHLEMIWQPTPTLHGHVFYTAATVSVASVLAHNIKGTSRRG